MKYCELSGHIDKAIRGGDGGLKPLYLIIGDDYYLISKAVSLFGNIVGEVNRDFNFIKVSADNGLQAFADALNTFPFFEDHKIALMPDFNEKPNEAEKAAIDNYLSNPNPSSVGVMVCTQEAAASLLKSNGVDIVDCSNIDTETLNGEIREILSEEPKRGIEPEAARELIARTLGSMSKIASELKKLKAYSADKITYTDVCDTVVADVDYQTYELSNAVSEKNADKAMRVLDNFMKTGVRPVKVLNLLYDRYRKMLHAELHKSDSEAELAALLEIKPTALYHVRKVSKNYTQLRLKTAADYLHELSYDVVSGRRQEVSALSEAVLKLLEI